jgi:hypothetical protein
MCVCACVLRLSMCVCWIVGFEFETVMNEGGGVNCVFLHTLCRHEQAL